MAAEVNCCDQPSRQVGLCGVISDIKDATASMKAWFSPALGIALLLVLVRQLPAATLCVRASSSGSASGADWNNALGAGFTPVRGNTYYLADGSYGVFSANVATSGSTFITIKKATVVDHFIAAGWSDTLGDGVASFTGITFSTSHWYVDGQVGGGPTAWNVGFGFVVYNAITPVVTLSGTVNHITLRHTAIGSDRGATTDPGGTTGNGFGGGIKGTTGACSSITVSYCAITNIYGPIFHISAWTDTTVEYCYLARNRSTADWHSEGVSSISGNTNCVWRWNLWDQVEGTAIFAGVNSGSSDSWKIYGNIFSRSTTPLYYYWESGSNKNSMSASLIYQNTIVGCGPNSQGGFVINQGTGNLAYNNLFYANDANAYEINAIHDYTCASQNIRSADGPFDKDGDIISGEAHGQDAAGSPFVSYNADPLRANYAATTESGKSDLDAPYNLDMFGNTLTNRGAVGFRDSGSQAVRPPTNLRLLSN